MKSIKYILLSLIFAFGINGFAQETTDLIGNSDNDTLFIPESWETDLDTLRQSWHEQYINGKNENPAYGDTTKICDSVYIARLAALNNEIRVPYNEMIRRYIDLCVDRRRKTVEYMLGLENFYFPMIEQKLDKHQLPLELKYLAVVESALNPMATSHMGTTGLWQFMLITGKRYGLEINSLVDERRDPEKATEAACAYFKDLYGIYGDWALALSAYNCGPGNVNKAIRRAGGQRSYWKIYPFLPKETRSYVPMFVAINYVMEYYAHHQFRPKAIDLNMTTDTVMVSRPIHFDQIAEVLNMDKDLIIKLNPQYKRKIIPGNSKPRAIKLPALQVYAFVDKEDSIANHRKDELLPLLNGQTTGNNSEKIVHRVKSGETVRSLEVKYGVSAASIRKWNGLKSNRLKAGRRLIIYVDNGGFNIKKS
jgi:membrane-bound lytic murein transglycosylase D